MMLCHSKRNLPQTLAEAHCTYHTFIHGRKLRPAGGLPVSISLSLSQEAFDVHFVRYWEPPLTQFTHGGARLSVSLSPSSLAPDVPSRSPAALICPVCLRLSGSPSLQCCFTSLGLDTGCSSASVPFPISHRKAGLGGETAQQAKSLDAKPDDSSASHRTYRVEGKNRLGSCSLTSTPRLWHA